MSTIPFHVGEVRLRKHFNIPGEENSVNASLPDHHTEFLSTAPLLVLGTLDSNSRPWTSIVGSSSSSSSISSSGHEDESGGFMVGLGNSGLGVVGRVAPGDPVLENLQLPGEIMMSGLGKDPQRRKRVKLFGKASEEGRGVDPKSGRIAIKLKVEQSMGNCPKYITLRHLQPADPPAVQTLEDKSEQISSIESMKEMISTAEEFYMTTRNGSIDMDSNHRGGHPGFVRILPADSSDSPTTIIWPEYPGNNLYSSLGNLVATPLAGLTFANFVTGDVLFCTGETQLLLDDAVDAILSGTSSYKCAVKFTITDWKLLKAALPLREVDSATNQPSPYNPPVYRLTSENTPSSSTYIDSRPKVAILDAVLVGKKIHTEDIGTFSFKIPQQPQTWKAGQHVMLDFSGEFGKPMGEMVKTFTISSAESPDDDDGSADLDITIRKVGLATAMLFDMKPETVLPIVGLAGDFTPSMMSQQDPGADVIKFVAGGLGITPFMALVASSKPYVITKMRLWWAVREVDVDFVRHILTMLQGRGIQKGQIKIFISGSSGEARIEPGSLFEVYRRRMQKSDMEGYSSKSKSGRDDNRWWVCAPNGFRNQVLKWCEEVGGRAEYETFEY